MDYKSAFKTLILALASSSFALAAQAQWQWLDSDGRKVFSDRPPPSDTPARNVIKQPLRKVVVTPRVASASATPPATAPSAQAASAPKLTGKDNELEARKKQAEEEEVAKKKAEEEKQARMKEENCGRAQKALITMQSGIRISTSNAKGEREFMDDAGRAAEIKRLQGIADNDCKK